MKRFIIPLCLFAAFLNIMLIFINWHVLRVSSLVITLNIFSAMFCLFAAYNRHIFNQKGRR